MFGTHKNGAENSTMTQWQTGKHLCPVHICTDIITRLYSYPETSDDTPVNTVWVENSNKNKISNDNQIYEVWDALLRGIMPWVFTQRGRHPLPPMGIFHGDLTGTGISVNDHDHQEMFQLCTPLVHKDSSQRPQ